MKNKTYKTDLEKIQKYWKPYRICFDLEYENQKQKIKAPILELVEDVTIYEELNYGDEDVFELGTIYRNRPGKKVSREELFKRILDKMTEYDETVNGDLESYIMCQIPRNYLKTKKALDELGKIWDVTNEICIGEAYGYIYEMYFEMTSKKNLDIKEDLDIIMKKELQKYNPDKSLLGSFVEVRMKYRLKDIQRRERREKVSRRKIPETGIISFKEDMNLESIYVRKMQRGVKEQNIKKGTYAIGTDGIYFSNENIGDKITIVYYSNVNINGGSEEIITDDERDILLGKERDILLGEERVWEIIAKKINFREARNKSEQRVLERDKICFSEKIIYLLKRLKAYEEKYEETFETTVSEVDVQKAVLIEYVNFFMKDEILSTYEEFFDSIKKSPLKNVQDISCLKSKKTGELKFTKYKWVPAGVPIAFYKFKYNKNIGNGTVTGFRTAFKKTVNNLCNLYKNNLLIR